MRKKIPIAPHIFIIIFASLSSIIIFVIFDDCINTIPYPFWIITLPFFVFWIITITFLIRLKNWARIAYIIIHIILALITLFIYFTIFLTFFITSGSKEINTIIVYALIPPLAISYFLIASIYFLRSDKAKLFKQ